MRKPSQFLWVLLSIVALIVVFAFYPIFARQDAIDDHIKIDRIVIEKSAHQMDLYADDKIIRSYSVALGRGGLGAKVYRGDHKTPEGLYRIDARNAHSPFHLSLHVSYPNATDVARAAQLGKDPGGDIMIHGIRNGLAWLGPLHRWVDWTAGCIAVTDREIEEIWSIVPDGTMVEIKP